jgi:hypothetical protein
MRQPRPRDGTRRRKPSNPKHAPSLKIIRIFDGYFPAYETEIKYKDIPLLVDKPVKGWPPEDIFTTEGDLVIDNPWEWNKEGIKINENYKMMLPTTDAFAFGETVFNPGGKNLDLLNRTF